MAPKQRLSPLADDNPLQRAIDEYAALASDKTRCFDTGVYIRMPFTGQPNMEGLRHMEPFLSAVITAVPRGIINQRVLAHALMRTFQFNHLDVPSACQGLAEDVAGAVRCALAHLRRLVQVTRVRRQRLRNAAPATQLAYARMAALLQLDDGDSQESRGGEDAEGAPAEGAPAESGDAVSPPCAIALKRARTLGRVPSDSPLPCRYDEDFAPAPPSPIRRLSYSESFVPDGSAAAGASSSSAPEDEGARSRKALGRVPSAESPRPCQSGQREPLSAFAAQEAAEENGKDSAAKSIVPSRTSAAQSRGVVSLILDTAWCFCPGWVAARATTKRAAPVPYAAPEAARGAPSSSSRARSKAAAAAPAVAAPAAAAPGPHHLMHYKTSGAWACRATQGSQVFQVVIQGRSDTARDIAAAGLARIMKGDAAASVRAWVKKRKADCLAGNEDAD